MTPSIPQAPNQPQVVTNPSEADVYDRQIRLWGAEAQSKMASARVLYVNITGISSEILKNLVLAGIRAAIADGRPYPEALRCTPTSFLTEASGASSDDPQHEEGVAQAKKRKKMTVAHAMQPAVLELNPLLEECEINESDIDSVAEEYFLKFDIVVASHIGIDQAVRIAKATVAGGGKFYLVHAFGLHACALMDLGEGHSFRKEVGKDKLSDVMTFDSYLNLQEMLNTKLVDIKDRWHKDGPPEIYTMFRCILHYHQERGSFPCEETQTDFVEITKKFLNHQGLKEDYLGDEEALKRLAICAAVDISPVCSVMGGVIGNEMIKVISGKGEPATNMLFFDGVNGGCNVFTLA